jgi:hypothetical protein
MMGSIIAGKGMDWDRGLGGSNDVVLVKCDEHKPATRAVGRFPWFAWKSERASKEGCLHGFCRFGESHMEGT